MFEKLLKFIFPNRCGFCGELIKEEYTCKKCKKKLEYMYTKNNVQKVDERHFDLLISAYYYAGCVRSKMLQLKYKNKKYLYNALSEKPLYNLLPYSNEIDYIIPVPISFKRYFERGYNQSLLIAKFISEGIHKPLAKHVLIKVKNNKKQSELSLVQRSVNVKDVYTVVNQKVTSGKRILLIDDIYTTGATASECSRVLKMHGARSVLVATIATADVNRHSKHIMT